MSKLIGTAPNQVPTNADLGEAAYLNYNDVGRRIYFFGKSYNNNTTLNAYLYNSGNNLVSWDVNPEGFVILSKPPGIDTHSPGNDCWLWEFSFRFGIWSWPSSTGTITVTDFDYLYRSPINFAGVAGLTGNYLIQESRADGSSQNGNNAIWFFEMPTAPTGNATYGINGWAVSQSKPSWAY